uniref:Uncharacterized protein n=1 Tax=Anguilla anguilla TaxID=7936 RepID=A0A0E9QNB1_ANGAN
MQHDTVTEEIKNYYKICVLLSLNSGHRHHFGLPNWDIKFKHDINP